jgi:hypothetical protein
MAMTSEDLDGLNAEPARLPRSAGAIEAVSDRRMLGLG